MGAALDWVIANYDTVLQGLGLLVLGATVLAKLTPTDADDKFLIKVAQWLSFLNPKGVSGLKLPLTAPKDGSERR